MNTEIQRVDLWKRLSAWLFDVILLACVVVMFATAVSSLVNYDSHQQKLEKIYDQYETQFNIPSDMTQEKYDAMSQAEKDAYDQACEKANEALNQDETALKQYNMVINLTLVIASVSILLAMAVLEFAIPLLLKNGQTLGKKAFGIAVIRNDGVRMSTVQFFVRTVLGKFAVETMIPVYMLIMILLGAAGMIQLVLFAGIMLTQIICPMVTRDRKGMHDLMAGTVAVDINTQRIFNSTQEQIDYLKQVHAEHAAGQQYS